MSGEVTEQQIEKEIEQVIDDEEPKIDGSTTANVSPQVDDAPVEQEEDIV